MRIGIFTDSYKPYTSGVVNSIITFQEELSAWGHEVYIFAPRYPHYNDYEPNVYRFRSIPAPTIKNYTLALPYYPGLNALLRKIDLDIIHVHSPFIMGQIGLYCARKHDLPLVFTYHTMYDQYVHYVPLAKNLAKKLTVHYSKYFCNRCDHIIVPSTAVEKKLIQEGIHTPVTIIPTGVSLQKFNNGNKNWLNEHFPATCNKQVLLYVGRLAKEKNLVFILQAFQIIHAQVPDTVLVLAAGGPLENDLKKTVALLGLKEGQEVIFTGPVPFEQIIHIYHSSHLFVFASKTETQGLVILEAMAAGLPVVAVNAGGVEDIVEHENNGWLCSENIEQFVETVHLALSDKENYAKVQARAGRKAEQLSSARMARELEQLYLHMTGMTGIKAMQSVITS